MSAFLSLPPESAQHLETPPGVAVTDGTGQIVVNIDNLRELVRMMEAAP